MYCLSVILEQVLIPRAKPALHLQGFQGCELNKLLFLTPCSENEGENNQEEHAYAVGIKMPFITSFLLFQKVA